MTTAMRLFLFLLIFLCGFALMGFEMLGSRYLNPWFGGGITSWACLISVVLLAMAAGYAAGGVLADRTQHLSVICFILCAVSLWLLAVLLFADRALEAIMAAIGFGFAGTMTAAMALTFVPVFLFAALSPFFVRLLLSDLERGGRTTGTVYAVSTMGNVLGTLVTVFVLIPGFGTRAITGLFCLVLAVCAFATISVAPPPDRSRRRFPTADADRPSRQHRQDADEAADARAG